MLHVCYFEKSLKHALLSDAEAGEDGLEQVGGGDGSGYGSEVVEAFADVLGYEVG